MSIKALTGLVPEWYTPEGQEDNDNPAAFELTPLKAPQVATLQKYFDKVTGEIDGEGLYKAAVMGITNWRNILNHENKPLKFSRRNIEFLPYEKLLIIGGEVLANSFITEDDEKNS